MRQRRKIGGPSLTHFEVALLLRAESPAEVLPGMVENLVIVEPCLHKVPARVYGLFLTGRPIAGTLWGRGLVTPPTAHL
jgi:hypothetical protein